MKPSSRASGERWHRGQACPHRWVRIMARFIFYLAGKKKGTMLSKAPYGAKLSDFLKFVRVILRFQQKLFAAENGAPITFIVKLSIIFI